MLVCASGHPRAARFAHWPFAFNHHDQIYDRSWSFANPAPMHEDIHLLGRLRICMNSSLLPHSAGIAKEAGGGCLHVALPFSRLSSWMCLFSRYGRRCILVPYMCIWAGNGSRQASVLVWSLVDYHLLSFLSSLWCCIMSSRADSTSPPPYSYENSSFVPPPPRVDQVSRSWDFQMKFEAAHEDVRWALLHTITAWKASGTDLPWDHIPRNDVQNAYDAAPYDLKVALDYIAQHNLTCYFNNDTDRRRHLYFSRRDAGWSPVGGPRTLLSPDQFVREFHSVRERVQNAVLRSIGWWEEDRTGRYQEPQPDALSSWYCTASNEHKLMINWLLEIGGDFGIDCLQNMQMQEDQVRQAHFRRHQRRQNMRSILKHFDP
ncbi:hypothetical protein PENSPDRAFT_657216 [Peniophora sp. CONT]|nr:hypothetical protein PENSPDRAFT_657216 [Peniophora sp. CONT]